MPHYPKPWFRAQNQTWYVQLGGKQVNLGPDEEAARQKYHLLMADHRPGEVPAPPSDPLAVVTIFTRFEAWARANKAKATADVYRDRLQCFLGSLTNKLLLVRDLKPFHVQQWVDAHDWSATTKRGKVMAVQTALNWAVSQGIIERSPIGNFRKPATGRRESPVTVEEWPKMLAKVKTPTLRDALVFTWETGCRPQELRKIEKRHCHLDDMRVVFGEGRAPKGKKARVIHLTPAAAEIAGRLCKRHPKGPIFRNRAGKPWKPFAMSCAMQRLAAHFGGRPLAFNDFRHGFGTRLLKAGVDPITVAALMGHADPSMLAKVYSHVHADGQHLRDALAKGGTAPTRQSDEKDGGEERAAPRRAPG